jgi:hypothetical protein
MVPNPDYFSWDMADWFTTSHAQPMVIVLEIGIFLEYSLQK